MKKLMKELKRKLRKESFLNALYVRIKRRLKEEKKRGNPCKNIKVKLKTFHPESLDGKIQKDRVEVELTLYSTKIAEIVQLRECFFSPQWKSKERKVYYTALRFKEAENTLEMTRIDKRLKNYLEKEPVKRLMKKLHERIVETYSMCDYIDPFTGIPSWRGTYPMVMIEIENLEKKEIENMAEFFTTLFTVKEYQRYIKTRH